MKGFLGIRLSNDEYFSVLSLSDTSVKKIVLGKLADETNVKLDFYVSEYEDFSNLIIIGSFFLDGLGKDNLNVNVYFKIESMILYVYGECDGISNKTKFDLSLMNLSFKSNEVDSDSVEIDKSNDLPSAFDDMDNKENFIKNFDSIVEEKQDYPLNLDNVNDLSDSQELPLNKDLLSKEDDLNLLLDSSNVTNDTDDNTLLSEVSKSLDSDSNLGNLNFDIAKDKLENNITEEVALERVLDENDKYPANQNVSDLQNISIDDTNDVFDNSDQNDVKSVKDKGDNLDSFNVYMLQNSYSDDSSVEDIIEDVSNSLDYVEFDDVVLNSSEDNFTADFEEPQLDSDLKGDRIQTSMLYLSLVSLFLLIFFSLFLIFSKVLSPKNFTISYCPFYREEKITECEKNNA
ncbi:hypothetical protein [Borrelia persica]|uniref:hypothetical protein n=1 Tax=Borrelia persica TaxID=44448 RepID=UPI0004B9206F|nr:hypothetical protein [Borrelia persica]